MVWSGEWCVGGEGGGRERVWGGGGGRGGGVWGRGGVGREREAEEEAEEEAKAGAGGGGGGAIESREVCRLEQPWNRKIESRAEEERRGRGTEGRLNTAAAEKDARHKNNSYGSPFPWECPSSGT